MAAVYIPLLYVFRTSEFAMALITALTICFTYVRAVLRKDFGETEWKMLNRSVWIIRICAVATGYWLFSATQVGMTRACTVVAFAILYVVCEHAAWQRKKEVEATAKL